MSALDTVWAVGGYGASGASDFADERATGGNGAVGMSAFDAVWATGGFGAIGASRFGHNASIGGIEITGVSHCGIPRAVAGSRAPLQDRLPTGSLAAAAPSARRPSDWKPPPSDKRAPRPPASAWSGLSARTEQSASPALPPIASAGRARSEPPAWELRRRRSAWWAWWARQARRARQAAAESCRSALCSVEAAPTPLSVPPPRKLPSRRPAHGTLGSAPGQSRHTTGLACLAVAPGFAR